MSEVTLVLGTSIKLLIFVYAHFTSKRTTIEELISSSSRHKNLELYSTMTIELLHLSGPKSCQWSNLPQLCQISDLPHLHIKRLNPHNQKKNRCSCGTEETHNWIEVNCFHHIGSSNVNAENKNFLTNMQKTRYLGRQILNEALPT